MRAGASESIVAEASSLNNFTQAVRATPNPVRKSGVFGPGKKSLEEENAYLRGVLQATHSLDAVEVALETQRLMAARDAIKSDLAVAEERLAATKSSLVEIDEIAQMQEAGVYQYAHPLSTAVQYKELLDAIKKQTKDLVKNGHAVSATTSWQVNGSSAQGRKMVGDFSKLLLRAYNAEADNCVRTVRPQSRGTALDRLSKAATTIERLGRTMDIRITSEYHQLRLYEIQLTADHLAKVDEERERLREERARLRDEAAAAREIEREKARLAKEREHYSRALAKAVDGAAGAEVIQDLRGKLEAIGVEHEKIVSREANVRAGWVYVISNVGSFGEGIVKIGLTRRLEPMDRVRELGDASVPFRFDVHALIFSDDAVSLETRLHQALADRKVNVVNAAREFFFATPSQVRDLLAEIAGQHLLEYTDHAEAPEWRASGSRRASTFSPSSDGEGSVINATQADEEEVKS